MTTKFNVGDIVKILDDAFDVPEATRGEVGVISDIRLAESIDPVYYVTVPYVKFPAQCWDDEITLVKAVTL